MKDPLGKAPAFPWPSRALGQEPARPDTPLISGGSPCVLASLTSLCRSPARRACSFCPSLSSRAVLACHLREKGAGRSRWCSRTVLQFWSEGEAPCQGLLWRLSVVLGGRAGASGGRADGPGPSIWVSVVLEGAGRLSAVEMGLVSSPGFGTSFSSAYLFQ